MPKEKLGSWVNLCVDDKNRIIASDQFGGLYRFPAPKAGKKLDESTIEKIPADIRAANGLLWAFDALYVAVNDYEKERWKAAFTNLPIRMGTTNWTRLKSSGACKPGVTTAYMP